MADYDGIYGHSDNYQQHQNNNTTATALYPNPKYSVIGSNNYHGVDIDTATIVSIASSCIILISGCIAVVCLIMYMKKTDMLYRSRTCAKCGAHVARDESTNSRVPIRNASNPMLDVPQPTINQQQQQATYHPTMLMESQQAGIKKVLGSAAIFRDIGGGELPNNEGKTKFTYAAELLNEPMIPGATGGSERINSQGTEFVKTSFIEKHDEYFEENEPTPYATFNLSGFDKDSKISEAYESFAAKFTEPPYMLLKKGIECPPQYADAVDYNKLRLIENMSSKLSEDNIYQSVGLSIASCSTNHEELLRAYEYGKQHKQKLQKLQDEFIECLNENDNDDTCYRSLPTSDRESPTDPGIREFTKSPPKPNEKRQGIVFHHQPTAAEMVEISKQMIASTVAESEYALKKAPLNENETELIGKNVNDLSPNETSNSFSSIQDSSSSNDSTPSVGSESANAASSSSTATPEHPPPEGKAINFGAIPRDRSRNPSWASFSTMKSNSVLGQQPQYIGESQLMTERSLISQSNRQLKEGLSSDEDDYRPKPSGAHAPVVRNQDLLEQMESIYNSRMGSYGSFVGSSSQLTSGNRRTSLLQQTGSNHSVSNRNNDGISDQFHQSSNESSQLKSPGKSDSMLNKRITSQIDC